jgi:excisionase family DNA binding protein
MTPEQLRALVVDAVREALATRGAEPAEWLDAKSAAVLLGVHPRTVAKMAKGGELPSSRVGRLLRFRRADVVALLERA